MPITKLAEFSIDVGSLAELRPALRKQMIDMGQSVEATDEIVDLSFHAAREAFDAFERVMHSASHPLMSMTIAGMGAMILEHKLDAMKDAMKDIGEKLELTGYAHSVGIGEPAP